MGSWSNIQTISVCNVFVKPLWHIFVILSKKATLSDTNFTIHLKRGENVKTIYRQDVVKMQPNHSFIIKTPFLTIWITQTPRLTEIRELLLKYMEILLNFMELFDICDDKKLTCCQEQRKWSYNHANQKVLPLLRQLKESPGPGDVLNFTVFVCRVVSVRMEKTSYVI